MMNWHLVLTYWLAGYQTNVGLVDAVVHYDAGVAQTSWVFH